MRKVGGERNNDRSLNNVVIKREKAYVAFFAQLGNENKSGANPSLAIPQDDALYRGLNPVHQHYVHRHPVATNNARTLQLQLFQASFR